MRSLFKRRSAPTPPPSPFVECRSWHGVSFHLRDTRQENGLALCGYEPLDDKRPVTRREVQRTLPLQHDGFRYCSSCVSIFLGAR